MWGFRLALFGTRMKTVVDSCKSGNESVRSKSVGEFTGKLLEEVLYLTDVTKVNMHCSQMFNLFCNL
jgi:hypothetical protein